MRYLGFLAVGVFFGFILSRAEVISWFRIQEMFRFDSFHMYGIIASAIAFGALGTALIKKRGLTDVNNKSIDIKDKDKGVVRYLLGGTLFGLGWALTGACPGPMFALLGNGVFSILIVIGGALLGTFFYGLVRHRLPH